MLSDFKIESAAAPRESCIAPNTNPTIEAIRIEFVAAGELELDMIL
jgi:hypothetical protein